MVGEELRSRHIGDFRVGKLGFHSFQHAHRVLRAAIVVSEQNRGLVGKRTYDRDSLDRFQWQHAIIFQQHHGFICHAAGKFAVRRAVQLGSFNLGVGNYLW